MRSIEEICDLCNLESEEAEEKLKALLSYYAKKCACPSFDDADARRLLEEYLIDRKCIEREGAYVEVTPKGYKLLERKWITKDYQRIKDKEFRGKQQKRKELVFLGITAIATAISAILTLLQFFN